MKTYFNLKKVLVIHGVLLLLFATNILFGSEFVGIIGEDVVGYDGIVLTVNEVVKTPISSSLRSQGKMEEVKVNLTLMNTGAYGFQVDPVKDFSLITNKTYNLNITKEEALKLRPFQFFAGMQTRLDLVFVIEEDLNNIAKLKFNLDGNLFGILCDPRISNSLDSNASLDFNSALLVAESLVEINRYEEARLMLVKLLLEDRDNPFVLILLSTIEDAQYEPELAATYLRQINLAKVSSREEINKFARLAMKLDNPLLVISVMEGPFERGQLDVEQKLLLARAYYVEEYFEMAEYVLMPMISSGVADKLAHFTMGNIFNRKNDLNRAIHQWEMALDVDPQYVEAYFNIGVAYYKKQDIERAREYWRKVLINNPDSETLRAAEDALKASQF